MKKDAAQAAEADALTYGYKKRLEVPISYQQSQYHRPKCISNGSQTELRRVDQVTKYSLMRL